MRLHRLALAFAVAFAALNFVQPARANVMIIIDKSAQKMTVTVDGEDRYTWPVSTGRSGYDTPSGDFQPFRMERDHFSREWDDAPMPNSIFFTKEGHAIHGTFEARNLGRAASHGCVRLSTQNAATLYALVKEEGVFNTRVRLVGSSSGVLESCGTSVTYTLIGTNGKPFQSTTKGKFGGHRKLKLYGRLDCSSALYFIAHGQYVKHRVFFADEATAIAAGYRPCSRCMPEAYKKWKARQ